MFSSSHGPDALTMGIVTYNSAIEQIAIQKIQARIQELRTQIGAGQMEHPVYKLHCGIIKGLAEAEELILAALKDIQQAQRGG